MAAPILLNFRSIKSGEGDRQAIGGLREVKAEAARTAASFKEQARAAIADQVKQRDALRELAAEYRRVAASSVKGSDEQVAAIDLARKAYRQLGTAASESAVRIQEAARAKAASETRAADETVAVWRRAYALVARSSRQAAVAQEASASSVVVGGAGRRGSGFIGRLTGRGEHAAAGEERGVLRAATHEAGLGTLLTGPAAITGFVAGVGIAESIKLMLSAQQANAQLQNALRNTGESYADNKKRIDELLESQEKVSGFSKVQLTGALEGLVRRTGSLEKAEHGLALATNLSRGAHISLDRAVTITTRAYQGNVGQLARLGIQVPKATDHMDKLREAHIKVGDANRAQVIQLTKTAKALDAQETATRAVDLIERKYHDAALTRSKTLQGQIDQLRLRFENWGIAIGQKVLPYAIRFVTWINNTISALSKNEGFLKTARRLLSDFAAGIKTGAQAVELLWSHLGHGGKVILGVAAAFAILTAASPFLAIAAAAIIAVGEIRKHWGGISAWFKKLWDDVRTVFLNFWDWIRIRAIKAALDVVEPFSHLPGRLGHWARVAKDAMNTELQKIQTDEAFRKSAAAAGDTWGSDFVAAAQSQIEQGIQSGKLAGPSVSESSKAPVPGGVSRTGGNAKTASIIATARTAIGVPYQYGGAPSLSKPTDCSGLMVAVFAKNGISLPRTSQAQYGSAPIKDARPLLPGDLVFSEGVHPGHVGLYIGDGLVLEDPHTGDKVKTIPLSAFNWNGESARWWGGKTGTGGHHGGTGGTDTSTATDTSFEQGIASATANQPTKKPKKKHVPATIDQATVDANAQAIGDTIHRFSVQLAKYDLIPDSWEKQQLTKLDRIMSRIHKGITPAELRALKVKEKQVTDEFGQEVDRRVALAKKQHDALARFRQSLAGPLAFAQGLISAFRPGAADPTQDISTAVSGLTDLGQGPDARAAALEARIEKLYDQLATLKTSKHPNQKLATRIRQEIQDYGRALGDELQKQLSRAQVIAEQNQRAIDRGWRDLMTSAQRTYDQVTADYERQFDAETQSHLDQMQSDLQQRLAAVQVLVQTAYGAFTIGPGGKTPGEIALDQLQAVAQADDLGRQLQDAQDALKRANLIGDPGQIRDATRAVTDAQRAIDQARLQQQATDERTAADAALQAEQDRLQKEYDANVNAYNAERDAAKQSYEQRRADGWQVIQDELEDWQWLIDQKQKSYADFLAWYANQSLGSVPGSFASATSATMPTPGSTSGANVGGQQVNPMDLARAFGGGRNRFATGAYLRTPTQAIVGDVPEFVVPESWLPQELRDQVMNILAARRAPGARPIGGGSPGFAGGAGGGGTLVVVPVTVQGSVVTERELSLAVRDHLVRVGRSSGGNVFGGQA